MTQKQTFLKILLAPSWDHNFHNGPASWLDNRISQPGGSGGIYQAPYTSKPAGADPDSEAESTFEGHYRTGRVGLNGDKYYRSESTSGNYSTHDEHEGWWPKVENSGWGNSTYFAWDCDPRVFDQYGHIQSATTSISNGGF